MTTQRCNKCGTMIVWDKPKAYPEPGTRRHGTCECDDGRWLWESVASLTWSPPSTVVIDREGEKKTAAEVRQMTIDELLAKLSAIDLGDPERSHIEADRLLLEYIGDDRVTKAHGKASPYYA